MWIKLSRIILRNRILLLSVLAVITVFFAYHAQKVEMSYEYASLLPKKDQAYKDYQKFVEVFGEEGNLIIVGIQDSNFFQIDHFNAWRGLCDNLKKVEGVENLLSVSNTYNLSKNKVDKKFEIEDAFPDTISTQEELDKYVAKFRRLPFYRKLVYNDETDAYLLAITVNKDKMASKEREAMVAGIQKVCFDFEKTQNVKLHYSGLPYIRVVNSVKIKRELYMFSVLALLICIVVLFLFFRSFKAVFVPVLIVLTGVVWAMGMLSLFGYKITLLSGMIPPLLIVIGIPNSIYMLNKFHHEYVSHGNKVKALQRVIIKIGNATFLTNLTTASGFATFIIVRSDILRQFGIIASLNILGLFLLSLLLIPIIFSFIGPPSSKHVGHLDSKLISGVIRKLMHITQNYRQVVYFITIGVLALGIYGISLMKSSGYMVDDIPETDPVYIDLKFFEKNFNGLMPLEIMVNTQKPQGVMQLTTFRKIEQLEKRLANYPELSTSTSLLNLLKFSKQAFYNGHERYYSLPNNREKNFILQYASSGEENASLLYSFLDSTRQTTRISIRVKDVGTKRMEELYSDFNAEIDSIFTSDKYDVTVTGSSIVAFKGNQYLLKNLITSLGLAILLISTFMAVMFSSWRMVIMSLTPNIIPLIFTAAIMGFTNIPIKASTILVFSIAFGISVDNTIHFLAKYRQELNMTNWDIRKSVVLALKETGVSMLYTSVVLFFGFGIFTISNFGGTQAMGILVSLTLLVAVTSNLVLLPSLLSGLERSVTTEAFKEPLLHIYDEEEDIELDDLEIVPDEQLNLEKIMYTIEELQQLISKEIEKRSDELLKQSPVELYEPIKYSLDMGGKRLRPVLVLMAYNLFSEEVEMALPAALGIEVFHNFTLLHDDIMDKADVRRNRPTVHKKFNENAAILSGDAMAFQSYKYFLESDSPGIKAALELFTKTAIEVCEGQQYDMDFETRLDVQEEEYLEMIRLKTAVLLACSLKTGAILAGASEKIANQLYEFGINLGLSFQLQDDLLDTFGDQETFGKKIGGDILANKKTLLLINALEHATKEQQADLLNWIAKTEFDSEEKIAVVKNIYSEINVKKMAEEKMNDFYHRASAVLDEIELQDVVKQTLRQLAAKMLTRKH